jgi:hypothetical protein
MTLMLAWSLARADAKSASIVFAMTQRTARMIAAAGVQRIPQIAREHPYCVRPSWEADPKFWSDLLACEHDAENPRLPSVHLRLLQRRLAELGLATHANAETRGLR